MKTKNRIWIYALIVMESVLILSNSCNKDKDNNNPAPITDPDGNVYTSVTIGTQVWLKENLKTTKYNDNTAIPLVSDITTWSNSTTAVYCWYDNNVSNKDKYGALYNWYSVDAGKLCPEGWHAATDEEWTTLANYLGGDGIAGGKLKEAGTINWDTPNTGATDESGFTALPGGFRGIDGYFNNIAYSGHWWSYTEYSSDFGWGRRLGSDYETLDRYYFNKKLGFSIRCVKN